MPRVKAGFTGRVHWHKTKTGKSIHIYVKIRQSPEIIKHLNTIINRDVKGVLYIPVQKSGKAKEKNRGGSHE